jgi:hypothetical protein
MKTIQEEWDTYVKMVYPDGLPSNHTQYIECRRAFYAGNASMFGLMNAASEFPEDNAVLLVSGLQIQLREFNEAVKNGIK